MSRHHFLPALAFSATTLAAVHQGTFVWLTAFVYHANIRGYVPAGITGFSRLFIAWVLLQIPLMITGRRRHHLMKYLLAGIFGVPVAIVAASLYDSAIIALVGYTLQRDIGVASFGVFLFTAVSLICYERYMGKKSDNNSPHTIATPPDS